VDEAGADWLPNFGGIFFQRPKKKIAAKTKMLT
jgi:hypothetical protein